MTAPNSHTRNCSKVIGSTLEKKFADLLRASWTILLTFVTNFSSFIYHDLPTCLILLTFWACLAILLTFLGYLHQSCALRFPCVPRIQRPWCADFGASHIMPDAPRLWNSQHNHATMLDIFSIMCIFSSLDLQLTSTITTLLVELGLQGIFFILQIFVLVFNQNKST